MKKKITLKRIIYIFILSVFFTACGGKKNKLELSFHLNKFEAFTSSDQMVVWLEKPDSTFVKTLFICDYLAYGGFALTSICPDWTGRADWQNITKEKFDAVTAATPKHGDVKFEFEFQKESIPEGKYYIFIEVHLAENYNELYSGAINFSDNKCTTDLKVNYIPTQHPQTSGTLLSEVKTNCN